jgi:hypothetical protein
VFTAIDSQEKKAQALTPTQGVKDSAEGQIFCDLLHEALKFYGLEYTLSVFVPESCMVGSDSVVPF